MGLGFRVLNVTIWLPSRAPGVAGFRFKVLLNVPFGNSVKANSKSSRISSAFAEVPLRFAEV